MKSNLRKIEQSKDSSEINFPKNYTTLYDFFKFYYKSLSVAASFGEMDREKNPEHDTESQSKNAKNENIMNEGCTLSKNHPVGFLPPNYETFQQFIRSAYVHTLGLSGAGLKEVRKTKKKHQWSGQLLKALTKRPYAAFTGSGGRPNDMEVEADMYNVYSQWKQVAGETSSLQWLTVKESNVNDGEKTSNKEDTEKKTKPRVKKEIDKKETAFLVAARNGIVEMVMEILSRMPSAIHDTNSKKENVLLVAVANRQPLVIETLKMRIMQSKPELWNNLILGVDKDENTILHLAAHALGSNEPGKIAGLALQMIWDIKWFQYIKNLVPRAFYFRSNKFSQTAGEVFAETHLDLIEKSSQWLKSTSESCSVVAALVASVSFATASTVPGGNSDNGKPALEGEPAFNAFAIASLVGFYSSVTALILFLSMMTSRNQATDFRRGLPLKLSLGLSFLFVSIVAMLVSFNAGHFFLLHNEYKTAKLLPVYGFSSLLVFFVVAQFQLYFDLLTTIFTKAIPTDNKFFNL